MKYPTTVGQLVDRLTSFNPKAFVHVLLDGDLIKIDDIRTADGDDTCLIIAIEEGDSGKSAPLPTWATRDGAKLDIDALYGWSNSHYGRYSQATDDEVIAIAADQRSWDDGGYTGPYPHKELP